MKNVEKKQAMKSAMPKKVAVKGDWDGEWENYGGEDGFLDGFEMHIEDYGDEIECTIFDADGNAAQRWMEQTTSPESAKNACEKHLQSMSFYRSAKTAAIYADDIKVMMGEWSENEWGGLDSRTLSIVEDFIDYLYDREVLQ